MSRPGSDLLDVPIFLAQARDRSPSMVSDIETPSAAESPISTSCDHTSPVCIVTEERDLQQQVPDHVTLFALRRRCLFVLRVLVFNPLSSARQQPNYGDCLEVKREYYQNCAVLDCVTQCSQSAAHLCEQFLEVQKIGFVTLGPLRCM